jgi:hypothetical protein
MTEDDIYLLLATLAGGQVYPYVAPLAKTANRPSHRPGLSFPSFLMFPLMCCADRQRAGFPSRSMCIPQP